VAWALALATTALAWMSPNPKQDDGGKLNISATGAMSIDNSRGEAAILRAPALVTMPPLRLGLLPAGAKRRFRLVVRLPEPGRVDKALMGARLRFDYRWRLTPPRP
jgi:hypothetical protein